MAKIRIVSNPYERLIQYYVYNEAEESWDDVKKNNPNSKLRDDETEKSFLPFRINEIIDIIIKEYEGENIDLIFEGTLDEYEEVRAVCQDEQVADIISITRSDVILENARLIFEPTKEIFSKVEPIIAEIVKDDSSVIKKLNKVSDALNDIIPICVFGNVSAGKSTFINSLIGHEILPSGGDPVTAKIFRIERSSDEDIARISFSYRDEKYEILFEGLNYRIIEGNTENDIYHDLKTSLEEVSEGDMFGKIRKALQLINDYEKKDKSIIEISNIIKIRVPFSKNGMLGLSYNQFVIFDTPGSNSNSNIEHTHVLEEALEGFSNGIPVWVTTYDTIDSTDNASLCDKILNIQALDKRFTMIVVNRADASDLDEGGFTKKREQEILEYSSVEKMYSSGIYFVSSIMGMGAKSEDKLVDNHYRKVYRSQYEMYSNPEDEDYVSLYNYNIMPEQIKENVKVYSEACANLVYANSGLFCIENEMENFASKYAAYNKCQMVYMFLKAVISETDRRINAKTDYLKRTREIRKKELESTKAKLIDTLLATAQSAEFNFEKVSKEYIKTYTSTNFDYKYEVEELNKQNEELHGTNEEEYNYESQKTIYDNSKNRLFAHLKENSRNLFKKGFAESFKSLREDWSRDYSIMRENKKSMERVDNDVDKETSDELLEKVVADYKQNVWTGKEMLNVAIKEHWQSNAQALRTTLTSIVTDTDALSATEREELLDIIVNYQALEFDDDADSVFIKTRFLRGRVLGIRFGKNEKLNTKRLAFIYNDTIKKTLNEMAVVMNNSSIMSFKKWRENLLAVIEENITEYNPQLKEMSDLIKEETDRIAELEDNQSKIASSIAAIEELMMWKEL